MGDDNGDGKVYGFVTAGGGRGAKPSCKGKELVINNIYIVDDTMELVPPNWCLW